MAILANGLETIDFGVSTWVATLNSNFSLLKSITSVNSVIENKALATHNHDLSYEGVAATITQPMLESILSELDIDIKFTNNTEGIVVQDTVALSNARIYIDNGVILSEVVV